MLNDRVGKNFRARPRKCDLQRSGHSGARVLIVDPGIGSRLLLADEVARAGFVPVTAGSAVDARVSLERGEIVLVLADENVSGPGAGLDFLIEMRTLYPDIPRAFLAQVDERSEAGRRFEGAGISFVLSKPLDVNGLREALRRVILGARNYRGWEEIRPGQGRAIPGRTSSLPSAVGKTGSSAKSFRHEMLLRGLLAGLNSIELEEQLFYHVHQELAEAFQIQQWLFVDQSSNEIKRIRGKGKIDSHCGGVKSSSEEQRLLRTAQRFEGVHILTQDVDRNLREAPPGVCLGFVLEDAGNRALTCLVWCEAKSGGSLLEMLRDLRHGLKLTLRRLRDAQRRAEEARQLAQRVSAELKTPMGALTHALDHMRGEAVRAGMSTESLDRVLSESRRVFQAVDHLEDEILMDRPIATPTAG